MQAEGGSDVKKQIGKGYEMAMYKPITPEKLQVFEKLYNNAYARFKADRAKASMMAGNEKHKQDASTAALVVVAGAMMNLDEFITKN